MKYLKVGRDELAALLIIAGATLLRLILIGFNWPQTNSDEGTMGMMALHIAFRGERPTFFYGQNYMGPFEAYLGAGLFHLFGVSLFTLRLGLVLCFVLFLICTYLLTCMIYSKKFALCVLIFLSLGSWTVLMQQLLAIGGYPETLLFGSLLFLLSTWLVYSHASASGFSLRQSLLRLVVYAGWGFIAGLAIWTDQIILPIIAMAGLLILIFCWREMLKGGAIFMLAGTIVGMYPLIRFNLHAPRGQDSITTLLQLRRTSPVHTTLLHQVAGTLNVSLPTVTGNPFCPVSDLPIFGPTTTQTSTCVALHVSWSLAIIVLCALAALLALLALWRLRIPARSSDNSQERRVQVVQQFVRLALLGSAALTVLLYTLSPAAGWWSSIHSHYLIGVLVSTPAVLFPLWHFAVVNRSQASTKLNQASALLSRGILIAIAVTLVFGVIRLANGVPAVIAANQQESDLIHNLEQHGITHIYTEYWTCDTVAFESQERIICGVLEPNLQTSHDDRYMPYMLIVKADPRSAYVFLANSPQASAIAKELALHHTRYLYYTFGNYKVYQPVISS